MMCDVRGSGFTCFYDIPFLDYYHVKTAFTGEPKEERMIEQVSLLSSE